MVIPIHLMSKTYFMVCFPEGGWVSESLFDSISLRAKAAASRKKSFISTCTEKKGWEREFFFFYYIEIQTIMPSALKNAHLNETKVMF